MKEDRQEKLKISNDLLEAMLVGVKIQEDLWGKGSIITQLNKALLELNNTDEGRVAGTSRNGYGKKTLKSKFGHLELSTPRDRHKYIRASDNPKVTDAVNEEVEQWHNIPLEAVYPIVLLDGFVVKVHQEHQVLNKTIYLALAINMEGYKEFLGIWIAEHEGA
ncbi:MAG: transposase [Synergistaceae bacterium]|nr:transposase [Synergistaceae bacterium]